MIEVSNKVIKVASITTLILCHVIYRSISFQFYDDLLCNGKINYPWISPNDEANCSSQCPSHLKQAIPCDCNKLGNMKVIPPHMLYFMSRDLQINFVSIS